MFAGALVTSLALHLNLAVTRRTVRHVGNLALGDQFKGRLDLGEVDRLTLHGLAVRSAVAYDPRGAQAARIDGLRATYDVPGLVRGLLFGSGDLNIGVPLIHIDHADVLLEQGPDGGLTIAEVFVPRVPKPPPPPSGPFHVGFERIEIDHVWIHGQVAPPTGVDADVRGLVASIAIGQDGVAIDADKIHLDGRMPSPQPVSADVSAHLKLGDTLMIGATVDGKAGDVGLHVAAKMDGAHVTARVEVPSATPAAIAGFLPPGVKLPLKKAVSETVEIEGDLPDLTVKSRLSVEGGGGVAVDGKVHTAAPVHIEADAAVTDIDPRVALDVPTATPVNATAHAVLDAGESLKIKATATTQPFQLGPNLVPGVDADAALENGTWTGSARVREAGAPVTASFGFDKRDGLRFEVDADVPSISGIPRLRLPVGGAAQVHVAGVLRDGVLKAKARGRVRGVTAPGGVEVDDGLVEGRVEGPLDALEVDAGVMANGVRASGYAWQQVRVAARGPVAAPRVEAVLDEGNQQSVGVSADVDPKAGALLGVHLDVKRAGGQLTGEIKRVGAGPGGVVVEGLQLQGDGVGHVAGGLTVRDKEIVGRLRGSDVDLAKLASIAGLHAPIAGLANVDIDLASSHAGSRYGHVAIELQDGKVAELGGVSALLTATFEGDKVKADGLLRLIAHAGKDEDEADRCDGAIAQVNVTGGEGLLAGPLLDPATWGRLSGRVRVAADDWNLHCVARLAPVGLLLSEIRGKLTTRAVIARAPGAPLPSIRGFLVKTHGLDLAGPRPLLGGEPAWSSRSVDVDVRGSFDTGTGVATTKVELFDGGTMLTTDVSATLDLPAILGTPEQRLAALRRAPINGHIRIPRRPVHGFKTLPSFIAEQIPPINGDVQLGASLEGTIEQPYVKVKVKGWDLAYAPGGASSRPVVVPFDLAVETDYNGHEATLDTHVHRKEKSKDHEVLAAKGKVSLELADVLAKRPIKPKGELGVKLTDLPLNELTALTDHDITGHLGGTIEVKGLGERPTLLVDLAAPDLHVGQDLAYDRATVKVETGAPQPVGKDVASAPLTARIELAGKGAGSLAVGASATLLWKEGLVPSPDMSRPAKGTLEADQFRVAALLPFVAPALSRLDGRLNGRAEAAFGRLNDADNGKLTIALDYTDGVLNLPKLGQELHDAGVSIKTTADGSIHIDNLRARGTKGGIGGSGRVQLRGLSFLRADANVVIAPGDELPITLEGVPLGDARGEVAIQAEKKGSELAVDVTIPQLHVDLPAALGRGVQSLDDNPDITITPGAPKVKEQAQTGGGRLAVTFHIGSVEIAGNMLDFALTGSKTAPLQVEIEDKAKVSGEIHLTRGRIELMQKQFEVEHGVVHLRPEDPSNPYVNVKARWDSPDGTIYIEYVGLLLPVSTDKLKYSSPTIPEDQILATLLFGGEQQSTVGGQGGNAVPGQTLAMQLLAQQFSTQISSNLSTSIGTGDDGSLRPGLKYRKGNAEVEVSTYEGTASGGSSGSAAAKSQRTLITLDWRFWHNWLLRGRVDAGSDQTVTGLDVLWQYRY